MAVKSGEIAGSATAAQFPNVPCRAANIQAVNDNTGRVYIGGAGVTIPNGSTDTTSGFILAAGAATGWFGIHNLNQLYYICTAAGDDLVYITLD